MNREVVFCTQDVLDFYKAQEEAFQRKIDYVFDLVRFERRVPIKFYKKLEDTDGIYEIRVITLQKSIRFLCFHDDGHVVVLTNGFIKKTQRTPKSEIKMAEKIKKAYLNQK